MPRLSRSDTARNSPSLEIQTVARLIEIGLAGLQQTKVAQNLTFRASISHFAGDHERRIVVIPRFVESAKAVVNHSEVAQHEALEVRVS